MGAVCEESPARPYSGILKRVSQREEEEMDEIDLGTEIKPCTSHAIYDEARSSCYVSASASPTPGQEKHVCIQMHKNTSTKSL